MQSASFFKILLLKILCQILNFLGKINISLKSYMLKQDNLHLQCWIKIHINSLAEVGFHIFYYYFHLHCGC